MWSYIKAIFIRYLLAVIWDLKYISGTSFYIVVAEILGCSPFRFYHKFPKVHWNQCGFLREQTLPKFYPEKLLAFIHRKTMKHFTLNPSLTASPCLMEESIV